MEQEIKKMSKEIKDSVKEKYSQIVERNQSCGCGCGNDFAFPDGSNDFSKDYSKIEGYAKDADYGLGCGIPTGFVRIKEGGSKNIEIVEEKKYVLSENLVKQFLSQDEYDLYKTSSAEILSITVCGEKSNDIYCLAYQLCILLCFRQ